MERSGDKPSKMVDAKSIFDQFVTGITLNESKDEVRSVAFIVLEKILGITRGDLMIRKPIDVTDWLSAAMTDALKRINDGEPVQYVVNEAFFCGRMYTVNPSVLIPRPETEELVRVALAAGLPSAGSRLRIVDIGTGSGCIAITLSLELKDAEVFAIDISREALDLARKNAQTLGAQVTFLENDILAHSLTVDKLDLIVSNPPYVTADEAAFMQRNVKDFEPHLALFVPNDDPLLFYRAITGHATQRLNPGGVLAVEVNEKYGSEVAEMFTAAGFDDVEIFPDVQGKPRVVRCRKNSRPL